MFFVIHRDIIGHAHHANIEQEGDFTECYVGGFGKEIDDKSLYTMFSQFGRIANASVKTDKSTGLSRGFGFVRFVEHESAVRAIQVMFPNIVTISQWHAQSKGGKSPKEEKSMLEMLLYSRDLY